MAHGQCAEMANWSVWVFKKDGGRSPFEKWKASNKLTTRDRAAMDAKILTIESWGGERLMPETLKDYQGSDLKELKIRGDKKQLRPLCIVDDEKKVIILCGAIEKDWSIPDGDIKTAENLREEYLSERGSIERYFKD